MSVFQSQFLQEPFFPIVKLSGFLQVQPASIEWFSCFAFCCLFVYCSGSFSFADIVAAFGSNLLGQLLPLHCTAKAF